MVHSLNKEHYFTLSLGVGKGINTKVEMLILWGLLQFSSLIGILDICIFGDSKLIIEWINGNYNLQVLLLKHWCRRIVDFKKLPPSELLQTCFQIFKPNRKITKEFTSKIS